MSATNLSSRARGVCTERRAVVESLENRTLLSSVLIPQTARTGMAYDAKNNTLYIPTGGATVARYDVTNSKLLTPLTVGGTVLSAAISPNDSIMYVTDTTAGATAGVVHKVNLATNVVTDLFYKFSFLEGGSWDIAMGADGKALFTTRFNGSGWTPLRLLNSANDQFTTVSDQGTVRQDTLLAGGPGGKGIFLEESNISSGTIHYYSAASDTITASTDTGMFLGSQTAAVDRTGNLIAMVIGSNVTVMDKTLATVKILSGVGGGVAFDPLQNILYTVDTTANKIVAYSTDTWQVKFTMDVGEATGPSSEHGAGQMLVTNDDKNLFLATSSGIRRFALPSVATPGSISGVVFSDTSRDGKQQTGEKGIANVTVYIDANKNGKLDTGETRTITNSSGSYTFSNVAVGTYQIREVLPAGQILVAPAAGFNSATVAAGKNTAAMNFADAPPPASISGTVFNDANADAKLDNRELGLGLWQVYLDLNNDGKFDTGDKTLTTDVQGHFTFSNLAAGKYLVRIVQISGAVLTSASSIQVTLVAGQKATGVNFGEAAMVVSGLA